MLLCSGLRLGPQFWPRMPKPGPCHGRSRSRWPSPARTLSFVALLCNDGRHLPYRGAQGLTLPKFSGKPTAMQIDGVRRQEQLNPMRDRKRFARLARRVEAVFSPAQGAVMHRLARPGRRRRPAALAQRQVWVDSRSGAPHDCHDAIARNANVLLLEWTDLALRQLG